MIKQANWIKAPADFGEVCPVFKKTFAASKEVAGATVLLSAIGVYEAHLNGKRIGDFIFAPGWTAYQSRVQFQEYDITGLLLKENPHEPEKPPVSENTLEITLGRGWSGAFSWYRHITYPQYPQSAIICAIKLKYADGTEEIIISDESFNAAKSNILYSDIYDGEIYDARPSKKEWVPAEIADYPKDILIPQQGDYVREIEEIKPVKFIKTLIKERIIDFGQNLTGYVKINTKKPSGDVIEFRHAEVLREKGTFRFYTENLRTALQRMTYISNGEQTEYKPHFTFQGFRYIKLDKWSGDVDLDDFTAVVVHSDMKRTGYFECSNEKVNQLFKNIIWGQKGNFLDVPTDCPQRDERCGWTGDAQVFVRTASYNYDVKRFFEKWLADLAAEQYEDGGVPAVIPNPIGEMYANSTAWGDAAVICPWQIYLTYGDSDILKTQFDSMKKWVDYVRSVADENLIWTEGTHFGDWLALDNGEGANSGATPKEYIATAYFAYSTSLLIKAWKVLMKDSCEKNSIKNELCRKNPSQYDLDETDPIKNNLNEMELSEYENLYKDIVAAFQNEYIKDGKLTVKTQTAHAVALYFDLCGENKASTVKDLADMVIANGNKLTTGFVGTPYLLHALSDNGYSEVAYSLLLQEEFPSWLFSVNKGATTIWEHWDGIKEDGSFWSEGMNSFNHYAFGAVADWMYGVVCGINTDENAPGFEHVILKPVPDKRLEHASASIDTKYGKLSSKWHYEGESGKIIYELEVPNTATITIGDNTYETGKGIHRYETDHDQIN